MPPNRAKALSKSRNVKTIPVDRYLFVQVHTNQGLTGLGESGAWGFLEASEKAVETFKRYLVGQDPLRIEHHWQYLYRWTHFSGAAIKAAHKKRQPDFMQDASPYSRTKSQSGSPELFLPGAVNCRVPALENGEPAMAVKVLAVGSNQRAVTPLRSLPMATVIVPPCGR